MTERLTTNELKRIAETKQTIHDATEDLRFDEGTHTYHLGARILTCVSDIVETLSRPFDEEKEAARCSANPKSAWGGMDVKDILQAWRAKKDQAESLGTKTHAYAETLFACWHAGKPFGKPQTAQQEACLRWWRDLDPGRWIPIMKETPLCDPVRGCAGTPDLILYDRQTGRFAIRDWKTNENLLKKAFAMMRPPLTYLPDNPVGHYTVQQNLYAEMLIKIGVDIEDITLVWLREDGQYTEMPLKLITSAVAKAADVALSKYRKTIIYE